MLDQLPKFCLSFVLDFMQKRGDCRDLDSLNLPEAVEPFLTKEPQDGSRSFLPYTPNMAVGFRIPNRSITEKCFIFNQ